LRVNALKTTRQATLSAIQSAGIDASPTPFSPHGIRLSRRVPLGSISGLREGAVDIQDEGSQLLALLVGARPGELVVDFCAGSGGKTLALAAEMDNRGRLLALDIDAGRLARGAARCAKAGVSNVQRRALAPGADVWLKRQKRKADRVLVDAPCSGVGAWRRNPDARWFRSGLTLGELLPLQAEVLTRASRLVRPNGTLVYATCSLLAPENDDQVGNFLRTHPEFRLSEPPDAFPGPIDRDGCMRLSPARHGCDGFFGAVMRRLG
jgi:16S rRNA (cytosine967-C5)-methyltransferase